MGALRLVIAILMILGLDVSMLAVTCLQHWYQGRLDAHHSIFELKGGHHHSEPLGEEGNCQLTSADDHLLLTLTECKPFLMPAQAPLPPDQPFESFIAASPLAVLKIYHSPPVKPPTLQNS